MYESLTAFLPELNKTSYGDWVIDRENDGSPEHPIHFPFVNYDDVVVGLWHVIYDFEKNHPDYELTRYSDILAKSSIKWEAESMEHADVSDLDGQTVMALLMAATRAERFCEGAMLGFLENGCIKRWIQRLKDIDDGIEKSDLEEPGQRNPIISFKGKLQKMKLISHIGGFGPMPEPDEEVEQRLSISSDGNIWFTRYCFEDRDNDHKLISKEKIPTDGNTIKTILDAVTRSFEKYEFDFVTDVAGWELVLTDEDGKETNINGSVYSDSKFHWLSDFIRENLGRKDLLLFDGNPDRIERIEVTYDRHLEMEIAKPVNPAQPYAIWDYHENIVIDRATETIEHFRQIFSECDVRNTYHIAEGVSNFLDEMDVDALSEVEGNPQDIYVDPHRTDSYKILVTTKLGGTRKTTGTFDKKGLPKDWPEFADKLYDFLSFYGIGEFFDERTYGKVRRRNNDLIFCNVVFENGGKEYCYQSSEDYDVGDLVIVPAGHDNHEAVVRIESMEYHPAEEAPFPIDKIKHVIRKFDEEKDKGLLQ